MLRGRKNSGIAIRAALAMGLLAWVAVSGNSPIRASEGKAPSSPRPQPPQESENPAFHHAAPTGEELDRLIKSGFAAEVRVDRVLVPAVVTDKKGHPIQGLTQKDFQLSENRVPQTIDYFQVDRNEIGRAHV